MNPYLILREDIRSSWIGFIAFVAMIAVTLSFTVAVISLERGFQQSTKEATAPFSLLAVPPGNKYAQLMQFAFLKPSQMELLPAATVIELLAHDEESDYVSPLGLGDNYLGSPIVGVTPAFTDQAGKLAFREGTRFQHPFEAVVGARVQIPVGATFSPEHGLGGELEEIHNILNHWPMRNEWIHQR